MMMMALMTMACRFLMMERVSDIFVTELDLT